MHSGLNSLNGSNGKLPEMRHNYSSSTNNVNINLHMSNNGSQTPHTVSTHASMHANTHTQQVMLGNHICHPSMDNDSVLESDGEDRQQPVINSPVLFSSMNSINGSVNNNNNKNNNIDSNNTSNNNSTKQSIIYNKEKCESVGIVIGMETDASKDNSINRSDSNDDSSGDINGLNNLDLIHLKTNDLIKPPSELELNENALVNKSESMVTTTTRRQQMLNITGDGDTCNEEGMDSPAISDIYTPDSIANSGGKEMTTVVAIDLEKTIDTKDVSMILSVLCGSTATNSVRTNTKDIETQIRQCTMDSAKTNTNTNTNTIDTNVNGNINQDTNNSDAGIRISLDNNVNDDDEKEKEKEKDKGKDKDKDNDNDNGVSATDQDQGIPSTELDHASQKKEKYKQENEGKDKDENKDKDKDKDERKMDQLKGFESEENCVMTGSEAKLRQTLTEEVEQMNNTNSKNEQNAAMAIQIELAREIEKEIERQREREKEKEKEKEMGIISSNDEKEEDLRKRNRNANRNKITKNEEKENKDNYIEHEITIDKLKDGSTKKNTKKISVNDSKNNNFVRNEKQNGESCNNNNDGDKKENSSKILKKRLEQAFRSFVEQFWITLIAIIFCLIDTIISFLFQNYNILWLFMIECMIVITINFLTFRDSNQFLYKMCKDSKYCFQKSMGDCFEVCCLLGININTNNTEDITSTIGTIDFHDQTYQTYQTTHTNYSNPNERFDIALPTR